jgi:mono/diheme cytochrome c family protein
MRRGALQIALVVALAGGVVGVAACGSEGIKVSESDTADHRGAELFAARCSGCHTLTAAGTEGSSESVKAKQRNNGPNLDSRKEEPDQVLYAIRNGGFSGAIMPQNIVVGADAQKVADFVAKYAGKDAKNSPSPKDS